MAETTNIIYPLRRHESLGIDAAHAAESAKEGLIAFLDQLRPLEEAEVLEVLAGMIDERIARLGGIAAETQARR